MDLERHFGDVVCTAPADFASCSPIEPSEHGGGKIAVAIAEMVGAHDKAARRTVVYDDRGH